MEEKLNIELKISTINALLEIIDTTPLQRRISNAIYSEINDAALKAQELKDEQLKKVK